MQKPSLEITDLPRITNPESILAAGKKIKLSESTRIELELVPGLPSNVVDQLLLEKHALVKGEINLKDVPGIGPAREKIVRQFIVIN